MTEDQRRLLVTGASGFVGGHVTRRLPGCIRFEDNAGIVDLTDAGRVSAALAGLEFDAVLHLAGQAFVPESFKDPGGTFEVNVVGTVNLLGALAARGFAGRVLYVSSGEVYGPVPEDRLPVTEDQPLRPGNPYAASKVSAESACLYWNEAADFDLMIARPFNHIGPGQSPRFAIADFARQLADIRLGRRDPVLEVGNIEVTRDFTDVRDVADAYGKILGLGRAGEAYNICSGKERTLRDLIVAMAGILEIDVEIRVDAARLRPTDQRRVRGSCQLLQARTGWKPVIPIKQSLEDILTAYMEEGPA